MDNVKLNTFRLNFKCHTHKQAKKKEEGEGKVASLKEILKIYYSKSIPISAF